MFYNREKSFGPVSYNSYNGAIISFSRRISSSYAPHSRSFSLGIPAPNVPLLPLWTVIIAL